MSSRTIDSQPRTLRPSHGKAPAGGVHASWRGSDGPSEALTSADPEALHEYASDPHVSVRLDVAMNTHTTADDLHTLALDPAAPVRARVAAHPHAADATYAHLALDADMMVHEALQANHAVPTTVQHMSIHGPGSTIAAQTGVVDTDNEDAINYILTTGCDWWTLTKDDPHVQMALTLSPN